jgi:putative IMPACT (imprinted ancient) family translation regulator
VRYFGGVKLGVGGLMQAYKVAADNALQQATIMEIEITKNIELTFDYSCTPKVMRLIKDFELKILEQTFEDSCFIKARLKLRHQNDLLSQQEYFKSIGIIIK